ncbi:flippase [Nodularia sp. NIES-3585]|uniref:flippase n=1 Tax=Nodularia sp. NIES-3585 TaxID=1973477 RepID=UPI000B5C92D9|nr:flippase [Nodularia sp. NIES-3585]GAX36710.1 polysaccharide biosynthesis protein [Nodularia sp. NIES-3585]
MLDKYKKTLFSLRHKVGSERLAVIQNIAWLFFDRILRMGVGLFVGVWVARYLGVQQFGIFNYATAFVALFSPLTTLGLDGLVIRSIVREPEVKDQILGTVFWLKLAGAIGCILLAVSSIFVLRQDDQLTVGLVAILGTAGFFHAFDTIDFWFQSQVQSKYTVVAKNTAFIITALIKVALIKMQAPLLAFAWAGLAEVGLASVGLIIAYRVQGYSILWRWSLPVAKTLLRESWPLMLSGFSVMIYLKIDQIMLGEMVDASAVGLYSAATRISEVWYFIPVAISSSVAPAIYAAKEVSEELYYQKIKKLIRVLALISILVALPMSFLSERIIIMLFGNSYAAAGSILAIHIWASLFVFMGVATSSWFIAEGLTHLSFRRTLMGAITNVFLNLLLIPAYAGVGAAIATVISYGVGSAFANAIDSRTWKIFTLQMTSIIFFRS